MSKRALFLLVVLAACRRAAPPEKSQRTEEASHEPPQARAPSGPRAGWRATLPGEVQELVVESGHIVARTEERVFGVAGGEVVWTHHHVALQPLSLATTGAGQVVVVDDELGVTAIDAADGKEAWTADVPGALAAARHGDGVLVLGSEAIHMLSPALCAKQDERCRKEWAAVDDEFAVLLAVASDGSVWASDGDTSIAFDTTGARRPGQPSLAWPIPLASLDAWRKLGLESEEVLAEPIPFAGGFIIDSGADLSLRSGRRVLWESDFSPMATAFDGKETLYVMSYTEGGPPDLLAISAKDGKIRWRTRLPFADLEELQVAESFVRLDGDRVVVANVREVGIVSLLTK